VWSKGIWVARSAGVSLAIVGILAIFGLIIIPTGMDDNNPTKNRTEDSMHMSGMNMDTNKNLNAKKPTSIPTTMPNMKSM
jgi:hypothetical protein